jgi:hypothetical protein
VGGRKPSDLRKEVKGFRVLGFVVIFAGEQEKERAPEPAGGQQETERPEKGGSGVQGFRVLGSVVIFAGEQEKERAPEPAGGGQETERPEKGG